MSSREDERRESNEARARDASYMDAVTAAMCGDAKHVFPAAERNRFAILAALRPLLPAAGRILEIASGSGQQVAAFAEACPGLTWFPSDPHPGARTSIALWVRDEGLGNVAAPMDIDVTEPGWFRGPGRGFDGIVCANLLHIAPWKVCEGLMSGAARLLESPAFLLIYGPFMRDGRHTSGGNRAFDKALRELCPDWGLRDVAGVAACAGRNGLRLDQVIQMPANNLSLVFRKDREAPDRPAASKTP